MHGATWIPWIMKSQVVFIQMTDADPVDFQTGPIFPAISGMNQEWFQEFPG
jgi:hypothetical protein